MLILYFHTQQNVSYELILKTFIDNFLKFVYNLNYIYFIYLSILMILNSGMSFFFQEKEMGGE